MLTPSPKSCFTLTNTVLILILVVPMSVQAQVPVPAFSKSFIPATIGPGSVATLRFDIANQDSLPVSDLAFTDTLPAGMTIATPASAFTSCTDAALGAADGGTTITMSGGRLGASSACFVTVNVTATVTALNTSGDLTSSAGNSGSTEATLTVDPDLPGFSKSFAPNSISLGGTSTLTLTIDNSVNGTDVFGLNLVDVLPPGMIIATPANASTDCENPSLPALLTAESGTNIISLFAQGASPSYPTLGAESTCTVTVDVTTDSTGIFNNIAGPLLSGSPNVSSGLATATLEVPIDFLGKSFVDDPTLPGGTVTLEFTVTNLNRTDPATNISFSDDLETVVSGLAPAAALPTSPCGAGSALSFTTGVLSLTGGSLPASGSCSFSVPLAVPSAATPGIFTNTTSAITLDIGGTPIQGNAATDRLVVSIAPSLTKEFTDDPVGGGDTANLRFSVNNTSLTAAATDIGFIDELTTFLPLPLSVTLPSTPCGAGSTMTLISLGADRQGLQLAGGNLSAGASCTFDVGIGVPIGMPPGAYPNVTTPITATVGAEPAVGLPATDILEVVGGPRLLKEFTDDPAQPGGTANLQFTIEHGEFAPTDATNISFTDDLNATLTGLAATGLPISNICGTGSQISGTTSLTFNGGTLAPGESCTFSVTLQIPASAPSGIYPNTTSNVTATVGGVTVTENPATDELIVGGLALTKEFTDDPAFPGGPVTLQFTIENMSPSEDATNISFTDALDSVISGLAPTGLPTTDICGTGSSLSAVGNTLVFAGGSLLAGGSCTFSVVLTVPGSAASNTYPNLTSSLSASMNGSPVVFPGAADQLEVSSDRLGISKSFVDDPVFPGDTVTLEFTISNLDILNGATAVTFTDDLSAALSGLAAIGLPANDVCGLGSQISGTTLLTMTGGNLGAGATCTFSVTVQVPGAAPAGTYINATSQVSGDINGFPVSGSPATDALLVNLFTFSKVFGGPVPAGGTTTLEFTIENLNAAASAANVGFTDDLDAVVPGMVAVGLPVADVCGLGSLLSGTSTLSLTGGNLPPGGSCTFTVDVQVPVGATPGTYVNTTSALSQGGIPVGEPASADIVVEAALLGAEISATTPIGTLMFITLLAAAAIWFVRWRA